MTRRFSASSAHWYGMFWKWGRENTKQGRRSRLGRGPAAPMWVSAHAPLSTFTAHAPPPTAQAHYPGSCPTAHAHCPGSPPSLTPLSTLTTHAPLPTLTTLAYAPLPTFAAHAPLPTLTAHIPLPMLTTLAQAPLPTLTAHTHHPCLRPTAHAHCSRPTSHAHCPGSSPLLTTHYPCSLSTHPPAPLPHGLTFSFPPSVVTDTFHFSVLAAPIPLPMGCSCCTRCYSGWRGKGYIVLPFRYMLSFTLHNNVEQSISSSLFGG